MSLYINIVNILKTLEKIIIFMSTNIFIKNMDNEFCYMLISGEISLIAIYLVFFPLIIENKNKEYYLGYRISDWILYKRKTKKYNDISVIWMTSIFIIISSIIFVLQKNFIIVFAEFIIFMIILSTKTIKYIRFISREELYKREIEEDFVEKCSTKKEEITQNIENNILKNNETYVSTIDFLLDNINNQNIKEVFTIIYSYIVNTGNQEKTYTLYASISKFIEKNNYDLNFIIPAWDWYSFLKINIREANEQKLYQMFSNIFWNDIKQFSKNSDNYNVILPLTYNAIKLTKEISEYTKNKWIENLIGLIRRIGFYTERHKFNNYNFIQYKIIVDFLKFIIDYKDTKDIEISIKELKLCNEEEHIIDSIISIYTYLMYLIEFEREPYINEIEKNYYKEILDKIKKLIDFEDYDIQHLYDTEHVIKLFKNIKEVSHFWERFLEGVKTPVCDTAIDIMYKIFMIYAKENKFNDNYVMTQEDLELFRYQMEDNTIIKLKEDIKKYSLQIGIKLNNIDKYIKSLEYYADILYKGQGNYNDEKYLELKKEVEEKNKDLLKRLKRIEIFNNKDIVGEEKIFTYNIMCKKEDLSFILENYIEKDKDSLIQNKIELNIYNYLLQKINKKTNYHTDGIIVYEKLLDKNNNSNQVYITSENDPFGREYKIGQKYNDILKNYKVIHTTVNNARIIIDRYEANLLSVKITVEELNEEEQKDAMKDYIKGDSYMINYKGYKIKYSQKEIKDYIKNNHIKIHFEFNVAIKLNENINGCFLLLERKK